MSGMTDSDPTDPRPRPQYGEYAPPGYVPPVPAHPIEPVRQSEPAGVKRETPRWDRILTIALLGVGAFGAYTGIMDGLFLHDRLTQVFEMQGLDDFSGQTAVAGVVIWVSHALLYLVAIVLSVRRLRAGRSAFWVPLVCGVVAALIFTTAAVAAIISDPDFVTRYMPT